MRRWFLSYNSRDLTLMEALEAALRRKDVGAEIFFAPKSLRAGGYWMPQLADAIAQATIFVLLVGEKGLGPWQVDEYYEARDRRVNTVLVLREGQPAPGLPFLRQLHWIITTDPASEESLAKLLDAAEGSGTRPSELWRYTAPYRGLTAMTEADSEFFFGRDRKTVEVVKALESSSDQLLILLGNSGVGKSSLAQAGMLAALARQGWGDNVKDAGPWPTAFHDSRRWCYLKLRPGTEPLKALVEPFLRTWRFNATDPLWATRQAEWVKALSDGKVSLRDLMDATERRHEELQQPKPPALLLYIDQGEELYVRAEERQRRRFSELINHGIGDHRLRALMSLRSDFLGQFQTDEALFSVGCKIDVPPLREQELRDVVGRPAELLAARFETDHLAADITQRAVTDSGKDIGALPLLSYLLDDMWSKMVERGDRTLRLPAGAIELGRILVERANTFLADHPKAEDQLRRLFTLKLATVLEDGEPTRRRALRSEFTDDEWKSVTELADHPYRLLVTAVPELGETYAEVAHEAIFRRWDKLRLWIAAEREFLVWRSGLEAARRAWYATPYASKHDALLMGAALAQAQSWLGKRAEDLPEIDRKFILQSIERERRTRSRARRLQALVYMLLFGVIVGLIGWINQDQVKDEMNWLFKMRPYRVANIDPYVLDPDAERALKPQDTFRECAKDCPEMVAIPAGEFMMGSPPGEEGRSENEGPQHHVAIAQPFAVSKFDVTFADWDACASVGGCPEVSDQTYGRDTKPLMNVTWNDAQQYVAWLAKMTGRPYRLLTEAEWEYAARAGATTAYYWGDEIGKAKANCMGCGSAWDSLETSPVGSFQPNAFGLYDMAGDVWQWVQDCENINYARVPTDGSAATAGDCGRRIIRGGSWLDKPENLRLARRVGIPIDNHSIDTGFRVGRTLTR